MEQAELGKKWLTELLEILGYTPVVTIIDETSSHRSGCSLVIDHTNLRPHQIQALIGTDGINIDAIQHMANTCLNAHLSNDSAIFFYEIELNDYRKERQVVLEKIAQEAIAYITEHKEDYPIKNLSGAERRQVHMFFEDYPNIQTFSEGKEPNRYLVVRLNESKSKLLVEPE